MKQSIFQSQSSLQEPLLSIKQAAFLIGVHYRQLLAAVTEGTVPSYQLRCSRKLVRISEVIRSMEQPTSKPRLVSNV